VKGGALVSKALATACAVRLSRASVYSLADLAQNRTSPGIELVEYHEEPQRTRCSPVTLNSITIYLNRLYLVLNAVFYSSPSVRIRLCEAAIT
jgi:hypothetical protein